MLFLKVTFFIMYLHIFGPMRWLRLCGYAGATLTAVFYGAMTITTLIFTTPRHDDDNSWLSHYVSKAGKHATVISVPQSVVGLAIDLVILILPIIAVLQLQLPKRRKIGVILIFTTGSL